MNKNKNNNKKKKKNLLFGQGLALHELRNLLVEASMRVRRDRFHSFRSSSTTKKKNTVSQIKDPSESKPQKFPPSKKKETNPRFPEAFTSSSSSSSFFLLLLLPEISRERNRRPRAREIEEHCFFCVFRSASFGSLSFWKFFGFWSLGDFKFFFLIVEILNSRSLRVDLF